MCQAYVDHGVLKRGTRQANEAPRETREERRVAKGGRNE